METRTVAKRDELLTIRGDTTVAKRDELLTIRGDLPLARQARTVAKRFSQSPSGIGSFNIPII